MIEIIKHGDPDKSNAYFICDYCGCEFYKLRGLCWRQIYHDAGPGSIIENCPDCDTPAQGMTKIEYLQKVKERAEADTPMPENGN